MHHQLHLNSHSQTLVQAFDQSGKKVRNVCTFHAYIHSFMLVWAVYHTLAFSYKYLPIVCGIHSYVVHTHRCSGHYVVLARTGHATLICMPTYTLIHTCSCLVILFAVVFVSSTGSLTESASCSMRYRGKKGEKIKTFLAFAQSKSNRQFVLNALIHDAVVVYSAIVRITSTYSCSGTTECAEFRNKYLLCNVSVFV